MAFRSKLLALAALFCSSIALCNSQTGIINKALGCFSDKHVYNGCQEEYRLNPEGVFHVPPEAIHEYCGGPCFEETRLVLKCIDDILHTFLFFNGASLGDIGDTLQRGCHGGYRGDYGILGVGGEEGYGGYYYGNANKIAMSTSLTALLSCVVVLLLRKFV